MNLSDVKAISIDNKNVKQLEDINGNVWWSASSPTPVNLFDPDTAVIMESYFQTGQNSIAASSANRMSYIECQPNTTYDISKLLGKVFWVGYTTQLPANGVSVSGITQGTQGTFDGTTRTSLSFTTGANASYLVFRYTQIYLDGSANADTIKNSIEIYKL